MEQTATHHPAKVPCPCNGPGRPLGLSTGRRFTVTMRGFGETPFLLVTIDLNLKRIEFETSAVFVHDNFPDTYAYVSFKTADGIELYSYDFIGTQEVAVTNYVFPLSESGGDVLYFHHAEHNTRCVVKNETTGTALTASRNTQITIGTDGIDVAPAMGRLGSVPTFSGNEFRVFVENCWRYDDVMHFDINLITGTIIVRTLAGMPCEQNANIIAYYYEVRDKNGHEVLTGSARPNTSQVPGSVQLPFPEGSTLYMDGTTVFPNLLNLDSDVVSRLSQKFTLKAVPRGLLLV
ncbi:putative mucin/carbohydrate-binding domain-containing protein [Cupriavidus agavae]|uniref:Carbohydrate-binding protein (Putative mucin) n=1 Tax=Cupriavidus agavae TaxID=1001822 RepID=A0A4Q7S6F4_9BURK|nr:putative mucin/carbohydrate-binding domain-containing protein [Cupriavidus agavae]RZT41956.1 carbohydrate-binding protein (putative mucin) [Cupriavidus agavae]